MAPTWTILVATLADRADRFTALMDNLLEQTEQYGGSDTAPGRVTILALWNNHERSLADIRQALVDHAAGQYVSFVDDDDDVPGYYVDEVMWALRQEPDYVGWRMQTYVDGAALKPTFHNLTYGRWYDDATGYYRDVSHLNPVRRAIARRADFRRGEPPEDVSWADQVRRHVRTQVYVDRVMYFYRSSTVDSQWRPGAEPAPGAWTRPAITHPNFAYHPWSYG